MTVEPPARSELAKIADRLKLGINEADMGVYHDAVASMCESWNVVKKLHAEIQPTVPARDWSWPAQNPLGAWYAQCDLQTTSVGPLAGRTVAIKDNVMVAGLPMMNGSQTMEGFVPSRDATIVTRLLDAGARIAGKAVCEDLCFSGGSHTSKTGPVRNPWDESRTTGGSSSGSGALVASGEVDMAIGGDQGGSIRTPASYCGIVGHKPTFGLVPYTGVFPIEQSIDHTGPMARTVRDIAAMLGVLAGEDGLDPRQPKGTMGQDYLAALERGASGLRIGVVREGFEQANLDPAVNDVVRAAVDKLASAGLSADEVSIPWHHHGARLWDVISVEGATWQMLQGNAYGLNCKGQYDPELIAYYGAKWREDPSRFSETVKLVALGGTYTLDAYQGRHYGMARNLEPVLRAAYDEQLATYDVLVMPTQPVTASRIPDADAPTDVIIERAGLDLVSNTAPFNVTGHPACSVPAGLANGLPVGLMVIGKMFDDATVLRVAQALETSVGGFPRPPYTSERQFIR